MDTLRKQLSDAASGHPGALGVCVTDLDGAGVAEWNAWTVLPTASTAKLLLLAELARRFDAGTLDPSKTVRITGGDLAGGTGLVRQLRRKTWTLDDLAVLVASVSDNSATNRLLRLLGKQQVNDGARRLGLRDLTIHDQIRDDRQGTEHRYFASSTARDLCSLVSVAATGQLWTPGASEQLLAWMATCTDHTLLKGDLHHGAQRSAESGALQVRNKTGTISGVRTEAGLVEGRHRVAYAALASAPEGNGNACVTTLRALGRAIGAYAA